MVQIHSPLCFYIKKVKSKKFAKKITSFCINTMIDFDSDKKKVLNRKDKSKQGFIDEEIKELVELINSKKNYYTTSSCAGRIMIIEGKKPKAKWLLKTHQLVTLDQVKEALKKSENNSWFIQEGLVIHVCCRTLNSAKNLLQLARQKFKRTGIISVSKKIVIEIRGTEVIAMQITKKGKVLVSEYYLKLLVEEANKKLKENFNRIEWFVKELNVGAGI